MGDIRNIGRGMLEKCKNRFIFNKPKWYFEIKDLVMLEGYASSKSMYRYYIKLVDGTYINYSPRFRTIRPFRVELNPNKCLVETVKFVKEYVKRMKVNRIDICVDVDGVNLNDYMIVDKRGVKKQYIVGRDSKLETIYLGSMKSDIKYRIYDKRREMKRQGVDIGVERMRVEVQKMFKGGSRDLGELLDEKYFDGFLIMKKVGDIEKRAMMMYLAMFPWEVGELSKYKRKKLVVSGEKEVLDVGKMYKESIIRLREELGFMISNRYNVSVVESVFGGKMFLDNRMYRRNDKDGKYVQMGLCV
jgi:hypothetical protein